MPGGVGGGNVLRHRIALQQAGLTGKGVGNMKQPFHGEVGTAGDAGHGFASGSVDVPQFFRTVDHPAGQDRAMHAIVQRLQWYGQMVHGKWLVFACFDHDTAIVLTADIAETGGIPYFRIVRRHAQSFPLFSQIQQFIHRQRRGQCAGPAHAKTTTERESSRNFHADGILC